jgi:hypothetical protein
MRNSTRRPMFSREVINREYKETVKYWLLVFRTKNVYVEARRRPGLYFFFFFFFCAECRCVGSPVIFAMRARAGG